ncbi:uncharacterized protein LOC143290577 [Babylonia areolata]|uniref:uncharacterized protein LOC143290577 n=1 Tax=Babylonia areolata TaxID=304850 RepID=UPI003FCF7775
MDGQHTSSQNYRYALISPRLIQFHDSRLPPSAPPHQQRQCRRSFLNSAIDTLPENTTRSRQQHPEGVSPEARTLTLTSSPCKMTAVVRQHVDVRRVVVLVCVLLPWVSGLWVRERSGDQGGVALSTFKLTSISQQLTDNGYRVQLHLTGTHLPSVYVMKGSYESEPEPVELHPDGYAEFYQDNAGSVFVLFTHPYGIHTLRVLVNERNFSQRAVPDMELFSQQGREVTFQRGNDVDVNVTIRVDDRQSMVRGINMNCGFARKSQSEDFLVDRFQGSSEYPLSLLQQGGDYDESERFQLVRVKTSSGDVEGLLEVMISVYFKHDSEAPLDLYMIQEDVPVFRNDHTGPFPDGFIGLSKNVYEESATETICSTHQRYPCYLNCELVGDQPSRIEIRPTDRDSSHPGLSPTVEMSMTNHGFRAFGALVFENVTESGEWGFQCVGSGAGGTTMVVTKMLIVVHDAHINHDLSVVSSLDNGTVEAHCVAEGTPAPALTFYDTNFTDLNDDNFDSYDIVVTQPTDSTSKAVLRIYDPEVANSLRDVICMADNRINGRHFSDNVQLYVAQDASRWNDSSSALVQYLIHENVIPSDTGLDNEY